MHLALSSKIVFTKQLLPLTGHSIMEAQTCKEPKEVTSFISPPLPMRYHCHYTLVAKFMDLPILIWAGDAFVAACFRCQEIHHLTLICEYLF